MNNKQNIIGWVMLKINNAFFSVITGSLLFCSYHTANAETSEEPPNVIIIMTDDQGYGDMSYNGHPTLETPNLDSLAHQGINFTDFHVSPYSAPTRASLMTGRDFRKTGGWHTYGGQNLLAEDETTIAEVFKHNGYATGHFGKWHLGINYPFAPHYRGFDTSLMIGNGGLGATDDYWGNDRFDDTYFLNGKPVETNGYGTDVFVDYALDFIKHHREEPFFVYLTTNIPHRPWNVPSEYRKKYATDNTEDKREIVPYGHTDMARYYGLIDKIDEQVGRVLDFLENQDLKKNTIVMFLTDNGTVSTEYNAGMRGRKGSVYEGGHRVPLFIRWPNGNFQLEKRVDELTCHMDIFPTLIDLCGLKTEEKLSFDGQSLVPLFYNQSSKWDEDRIYVTQSTQSVSGGYHITPPKKGKTVIGKQKWRLVNHEKLYNLNQDPQQKNDVADHYPKIVSKLKDSYEEYWGEVQPYEGKLRRVHLGNPKQPVTEFSLMNLIPCSDCSFRGMWSMNSAAKARKYNGRWPVYVEKSGQYVIELRRWPKEVDRAINDFRGLGCSVPGSEFSKDAVRISPDSAKVKIGDVDVSKKINPEKKSARFQVNLDQGPANLRARFIDKDGNERAAYWVYVSQ